MELNMTTMDKMRESWRIIRKKWKYKVPLKVGQTGYFEYGWTRVFLERTEEMEGGREQIMLLSRLSRRQNSLSDL